VAKVNVDESGVADEAVLTMTLSTVVVPAARAGRTEMPRSATAPTATTTPRLSFMASPLLGRILSSAGAVLQTFCPV